MTNIEAISNGITALLTARYNQQDKTSRDEITASIAQLQALRDGLKKAEPWAMPWPERTEITPPPRYAMNVWEVSDKIYINVTFTPTGQLHHDLAMCGFTWVEDRYCGQVGLSTSRTGNAVELIRSELARLNSQ